MSPSTSPVQPFAIVVWGCVLQMAQVKPEAAKAWIREQKLSAVVAYPTAGLTYNRSEPVRALHPLSSGIA